MNTTSKDGNQPPSDLRGDPVAPRTPTAGTRDPLQAVIQKIQVGLARSAVSADNGNYGAVTLTIDEAVVALKALSGAPHSLPVSTVQALYQIGVMAMTAQSDPHAEASVYRQALIDICNLALVAQARAPKPTPALQALEEIHRMLLRPFDEPLERYDNACAEALEVAEDALKSADQQPVSTVQALIDPIRQRLEQRRNPPPHKGTCVSCGHEQPVCANPYTTMASGMAAEQWVCAKCYGQITVMMTIGSDGPSADDDIETLLAALLASPSLHRQEQNEK